ncbi:MAG: DNA polymerase III subunit alpha [Anaerohalosphaeraceae bacterium]
MDDKGFIHLHLHTQYSLLDGAIQPDVLFERCRQLGMNAVAITDHGNLFGALDFYLQAQKYGIKPILGMEAYIAPGSRFERQKGGGVKDNTYHLLLLAENLKGYQNLLQLSSIGYTEGFYYRPRIDKEVLAQFSEGLICTSACIAGEIPTALVREDRQTARRAAQEYLKIFGPERFFIEIQQHENDEHPHLLPALVDLAKELGIGLVATNDVHFLNADDHEAHMVLCCINTGKKITDVDKMEYPPDVYLKSPEEMRTLFAAYPEACDNTLTIAGRCQVELDLKTRHAPRYHTPPGKTAEQMLTELVLEGAKKRYGQISPAIQDRINWELEVIKSKGFASYFLIVWDFCNYAKEQNIPVGARGSAVGTIVGYCLGICNIDPLRYDLLFERFMDPERNEMPDIDIDICQDGREKILNYVRQKYGHIAQIITFGTMKARAVIRDVCRVLDVPLAEADRLAKLVPAELKMTLDKALEAEPDLKKAYETDEKTRRVINIGRKLEGLARHASVHACGVVIADEPLTRFLPLYKQAGSEELITQFEGPFVEKAGLMKMDFLGLKTLSIIQRTVDLIQEIHGKTIDIEAIDIMDQRVYREIFSAGRTKGIFQFESSGMQEMLRKLRPDRLEDLIAANALYRPGPLALIPEFIERKHGARWSAPHPIMEEILAETFGIIVYQEQVMRICNRLGGIPLREAYTLIKAISKKKEDVIQAEQKRFIDGCIRNGLQPAQAEEIFALIRRFADYGFNKSHATRYSFVAYQTAWLKTYYPVEFMASLLTYEMGNTDKVVEYIGECRDMGIEVLPPDINESFVDFTVIYDEQKKNGLIRFGLAAVKGVGSKAVEQIIAARERVGGFRSLFHFCESVDLHTVNKQVLEALIKAGAFDSLGGSRAQMAAALEKAMQCGAAFQADRQKGQMNFFLNGPLAAEEAKTEPMILPDVPAWSEQQMLSYEKEVLGFYVTSNPLSKHAQIIELYSTSNTAKLRLLRQEQEVIVGGMITKIRYTVTKNGKNAGAKMAVAELEDLQGKCEVVLFPKTLEKCGHLLQPDRIVFVRGTAQTLREIPNIRCEELIDIEEAGRRFSARVKLEIDAQTVDQALLEKIRQICLNNRGKSPIELTIYTPKRFRITARADANLSIRADLESHRKLEAVLGRGKVHFTA